MPMCEIRSVSRSTGKLSNTLITEITARLKRFATLFYDMLAFSVPTQPGHPSAGRQNEYWWWLRPSPGKKRRVLRNSRPCYQDCWHTDPVRYLADLGCMLA